MASTDDNYWADYDGLQNAKHQILNSYLNGWLPKLSSWQGRVLYVDCHAGRGRHATGHAGSPILALNLLLNHNYRSQILATTEVGFIFFEIDQTNYSYLCKEIQALGQLPTNVAVNVYQNDYETELRKVIAGLRSASSNLAPTFAFVDPYGFTIPMDLLNELLSFPACELLINFMFRYVDMAIQLPNQANNMDRLFGCPQWRSLTVIGDSDQRAKEMIDLYSRQLKAKYVTHMYMRGSNRALKYVLFHATNHKSGRQLMKQAIWSVTPDGSFTAYERNSPNQPVLIQLQPDLQPLNDALWKQYAGQQVRMDEIYDWLLGEVYLEKHLHKLLRGYRNQGIVQVSGYTGRFAFGKNPLLSFPVSRH
jgi:three-Cys-motif partner protein